MRWLRLWEAATRERERDGKGAVTGMGTVQERKEAVGKKHSLMEAENTLHKNPSIGVG